MSDYDRTDEWNLDRNLPRRSQSHGGESSRYQTVGRSGVSGSSLERSAPARSSANRSSQGRKRKKRRRRFAKAIITVLLTILLVGLIGTAAYIMIQHLPAKSATDEVYVREIDITDKVAGNMALWLSTADEGNIDGNWVKERCDDIRVSVELTLSKESKNVIGYNENVTADSYENMSREVDIMLEKMLSEIIADNLIKSGYSDSVSYEEASKIAESVLETSITDYIKENGVNVVPTIDELNSQYTYGNGTLHISKGVAAFNPSDANPFSEKIVQKKDSLVLVDTGKVYVKKEGNNE